MTPPDLTADEEAVFNCAHCLRDTNDRPCSHCGSQIGPRKKEFLDQRLYVYVCPYCCQQYRGPGGHHVAGDDCASSCSHRHPGERGVTQPKLVRIEVVPAEPFMPAEIPHDRLAARFDKKGQDDG